MNKIDIENIVLKQLYDFWDTNGGNTVYQIFDELSDIDENFFTRIVESLEDKNLIKGIGQGKLCDITYLGIQEAENRGLIDFEKVNYYETIRFKLLEDLSTIYELEGKHGTICVRNFIEKNNVGATEAFNNMLFLVNQNFSKVISTCCFQITPTGIEHFQNLQKQKFFKDEFERLSDLTNLTPQQRGRELQKLIAEVLEFAGFEVIEGMKRSHEEMDVIVNFDNNFFLIECKWEKKKAKAAYVRELFGKLGNRADVNGIVISMSGFTSNDKGAVEQVIEFSSQKYILLFGEEDIQQIIMNPKSFKTLVDEKLKSLMWKKEVIWK